MRSRAAVCALLALGVAGVLLPQLMSGHEWAGVIGCPVASIACLGILIITIGR